MKTACVLFALAGTPLGGADPGPSAIERLGIPYHPPKEPDKAVGPEAPAETPLIPGTVTLPKFDVKESRLKLTEEDTVSPAEKMTEAEKAYISPLYAVTFGPLSQLAGYYLNWLAIFGGWHPNSAEATVLYVQDARLREMREFDDLADLDRLADPKEAKELAKMRAIIFRLPQRDEGRFYRIDLQQHDHTKAP